MGTRKPIRRRAAMSAMFTVLTLAGCGHETGRLILPNEVKIDPPFATLDLIGDTVRLEATVYYSDGSIVDTEPPFGVVWSSTPDSVAVVDSVTGLVRAVGPGIAAIEAEYQTAWSRAHVMVVAR